MCDVQYMRTTLNIDTDVLSTAKALAEQTSRTVGEVVSDLMRKAIESKNAVKVQKRNGVPIFKATTQKTHLTIDEINDLRDAE